MNLSKIYFFLSLVIIIFLIGDILNSYYVSIWLIHAFKMEPLYSLWLQTLVVDCLLMILILWQRSRQFGLLLLIIISLDHLNFLHTTTSMNPLKWLHAGQSQWAISIILQMLLIIICVLNVWIGWILPKNKYLP